MPADNAAAPDVTEATTESKGAQEGAPQQPATPNRETAVMEHLNLPPEIAEKIKADENKKSEDRSQRTEEEKKPEPEAEPTAEKPKEEEEEEDEHEEGSPFKDPRVQKRIQKATRQKEKLTERAERAEAQLAELAAAKQEQTQTVQTPKGTADDPLAGVQNEQQLNHVRQEAEAMLDWCGEHGDGTVLNEGTPTERVIAAEEVAKWQRQAQKLILRVPETRERVRTATQQRAHFEQLAQTEYPALFDKSSEDYAAAQNLLRSVPELAGNPAAAFLLGVALEGYRARATRLKAGSNGKAPNPDLPASLDLSKRKIPPLAPVTAKPPSSSPAPARNKQVEDATKTVVEQGGNEDAMTDLIKLHLAERRGSGHRQPALV